MRFTGSSNHEYCVVDEVAKLMGLRYTCYIEEELWIASSKTARGYRAVVDIYAVRGKREVLIEVGTLSPSHGDRLELLRKLKPKAKIVHVRQWKNYNITESLIQLRHSQYVMICSGHISNPNLRDEFLKRLWEGHSF